MNVSYSEKPVEHLIEQYKLFVNTSLDVTTKRLEVNKFNLTLNAIIFGLASLLTTLNQNVGIAILAIAGISTALVWRRSILAYKALNSAKFKVIHELEKSMPVNLFKHEDVRLKDEKYFSLTSAEQWYPGIFIGLYLSLIALISYSYFTSPLAWLFTGIIFGLICGILKEEKIKRGVIAIFVIILTAFIAFSLYSYGYSIYVTLVFPICSVIGFMPTFFVVRFYRSRKVDTSGGAPPQKMG